MRNEIYARHGWVFNRRDLQNYFEGQPWYRPKGDLSNREQANRWAEAELTPLERKNIQIIVSREKALKR
jgi:serine/threonine-protein kinase RIO1